LLFDEPSKGEASGFEEAEWVLPDRYMRVSENWLTSALHASVLRVRTKCNVSPVAKVTILKYAGYPIL
jgi:hypothetical protein